MGCTRRAILLRVAVAEKAAGHVGSGRGRGVAIENSGWACGGSRQGKYVGLVQVTALLKLTRGGGRGTGSWEGSRQLRKGQRRGRGSGPQGLPSCKLMKVFEPEQET
eukprot:343081-Pelagomonas_calceolata.AAC.2